MFRNYLKIAWRNLTRNKVFSVINLLGLSTGITVCLMIFLFISNEFSVDDFHKNGKSIYRVMRGIELYEGKETAVSYLSGPYAPALLTDFKGQITQAVRVNPTSALITAQDKSFHERKIIDVDPNFFTLFSFPLLKGDPATVLAEPASVVLSESTARKYFGSVENAMGKIVEVDKNLPVKVTGIAQDVPANSHLDFDLVIPLENYKERSYMTGWINNGIYTYVQLAPTVSEEQVERNFPRFMDKHMGLIMKQAGFHFTLSLTPLKEIYFEQTFFDGTKHGDERVVYIFLSIAILILLVACINFMNLSTARSEKRAKEVGIRKAIGSVRGQLIAQFFSESLLVVAFAFVLALVLVQLSLPVFNEVADKKLAVLWSNPMFWGLGFSFSLLTGLIAGSYPAFYLSAFQPIKVLKGTFKVGRFAGIPRQVLVVVQFTVSVTLIIGTIIVFRQIQHAKDRPIGYSRDGLLTVQMTTPDMTSHYNALRSDLLRTGAIADMSQSSNPPTYVAAVNNGYEWKGKDPATEGNFATVSVSHDFGKTVGWEFREGRDFSRDFSTDSSGMVLNEAAVKFMGLKQPVGEIINCDGKPYKVVGVIKDMVMESPYQPVFRTVFLMDYSDASVFNVKLNPALSASEAISRIEPVFKKYSPAAPFDYKFVDEDYARKFGEEERIGKLARFFAILAILISCLGIFGLATFMAEQRTKEIGVRKVLGATVLNLWGLLSKDFLLLVIIAFVIATPVAYYFLNNWLQQYEYRTEISWWIFAVSGAGALLITLLTVSFQSIKAALMNPVKSLRSE